MPSEAKSRAASQNSKTLGCQGFWRRAARLSELRRVCRCLQAS